MNRITKIGFPKKGGVTIVTETMSEEQDSKILDAQIKGTFASEAGRDFTDEVDKLVDYFLTVTKMKTGYPEKKSVKQEEEYKNLKDSVDIKQVHFGYDKNDFYSVNRISITAEVVLNNDKRIKVSTGIIDISPDDAVFGFEQTLAATATRLGELATDYMRGRKQSIQLGLFAEVDAAA